MSNITPEDARNDPEAGARAADEHSGFSIEGDTPPAEGTGVGPTNPGLDRDRGGEGAGNKAWLIAIPVVLVIAVVLGMVGRIIGFF
ncbi:DUF6480 family protein [Agrococcus sp. Marseille-P2731]|uniref:DUF6480 family protein n=1 Tax=Agrococcus sp. Marseille-P2731 TaxID=1841862 RepID=UPI000931C3D7|nr:DUF6480 family protein [Agrococcus sp. Marseille-P2731]